MFADKSTTAHRHDNTSFSYNDPSTQKLFDMKTVALLTIAAAIGALAAPTKRGESIDGLGLGPSDEVVQRDSSDVDAIRHIFRAGEPEHEKDKVVQGDSSDVDAIRHIFRAEKPSGNKAEVVQKDSSDVDAIRHIFRAGEFKDDKDKVVQRDSSDVDAIRHIFRIGEPSNNKAEAVQKDSLDVDAIRHIFRAGEPESDEQHNPSAYDDYVAAADAASVLGE